VPGVDGHVCVLGVSVLSVSVDFLPYLGVGPTVWCVFDYHCVILKWG